MEINTNMAAAEAREPRGGRIGVAFDWGLALEIALLAIVGLAGVSLDGRSMPPLAALGSLAIAGLLVIQGEALRRGRGWARWVQLAANSLLPIGGLLMLPATLAALQQGLFGPLYATFLLLVVSPLEVWLLLQPGSRQWYGHVSAEAARARHSGQWLWGTIAWALVGGVVQALAAAGRF